MDRRCYQKQIYYNERYKKNQEQSHPIVFIASLIGI
jgi:hypothetical protein